jgi:hypothetical protein
MKLILFFTLLLTSIHLLAQSVPQVNVAVEEQGHPATVGTLIASLNDSEIALIPGAFALPLNSSQSLKVELADSSFHKFQLVFSQQNGHLLLDSIGKESCLPERLNGTLSQDSPTLYHLRLTYSADPASCGISPSIAAPDSRVKLRFESTPSTAMLFFSDPYKFSSVGLPRVLSLEYYSRVKSITVFFKSPGYLDCSRKILIKKQGDLFVVNDGIKDTPVDDTNPPLISCTLAKAQ